MTLKNNPENEWECIFCCDKIKDRIVEGTDTFYAVKDGYPVTEGHLLVIPKRHVAEYFELSDAERREADNFMKCLYRNMVKNDPTITGYNIGVNCGFSAGQSIFHLHYHLIPRRNGDTENPRGGVRGVIPGKRSY
ncbi:MAG: HIT family protein [Desulfobacterales bacterium]